MSEITTRIERYHATGEGWLELRDWLAHRTYVAPVRYERPTSPCEYADWDRLHTDGAFDEVDRARNRGLLTAAEHAEVLFEADRYRGVGA